MKNMKIIILRGFESLVINYNILCIGTFNRTEQKKKKETNSAWAALYV